MNIWGWLFAAPILLLLVFDPVNTLLTLVLAVVIIGGAIWVFDKVLGPKK